MTDLTVCFVNKGLILFEKLLKKDFQDSSNMIKLVINKKIPILMFRD